MVYIREIKDLIDLTNVEKDHGYVHLPLGDKYISVKESYHINGIEVFENDKNEIVGYYDPYWEDLYILLANNEIKHIYFVTENRSPIHLVWDLWYNKTTKKDIIGIENPYTGFQIVCEFKGRCAE